MHSTRLPNARVLHIREHKNGVFIRIEESHDAKPFQSDDSSIIDLEKWEESVKSLSSKTTFPKESD